jgi:hypothetical protein
LSVDAVLRRPQQARTRGSVIAFFLLVDRDSHKCYARAIGRNLRVTDSHKVPEIFFGDGTLFG